MNSFTRHLLLVFAVLLIADVALMLIWLQGWGEVAQRAMTQAGTLLLVWLSWRQ